MKPTNRTSSLLLAACWLACIQSTLQAQGQSGNTPAADITDSINARPPIWVRGPVRTTPQWAASPSGYTPAKIRHAYGFDQITDNGAGQTIAIIDAYGCPSVVNDLATFCTVFGLPPATINVYYPNGPAAGKDTGWALETNLDVQWAHAIAPGARIAVVVAKSASISNLLKAVDYAVKTLGAKQVSMSWGGNEFSSETSSDFHFNKAGVSFFAASGDSGAGVLWPAASPYVVAVGGTTLNLDSSGNVLSETAWSGSGGGISAYELKPVYQSGWTASPMRGVPDISYNADPNTGYPVYTSDYNGSAGWITVGGTSAGAPQWAAMQALVNAARSTSLSDTDSALYGIGTLNYSNAYRDIISGNNGGFNATGAYDFVTGLGSPWVPVLVPSLIAR